MAIRHLRQRPVRCGGEQRRAPRDDIAGWHHLDGADGGRGEPMGRCHLWQRPVCRGGAGRRAPGDDLAGWHHMDGADGGRGEYMAGRHLRQWYVRRDDEFRHARGDDLVSLLRRPGGHGRPGDIQQRLSCVRVLQRRELGDVGQCDPVALPWPPQTAAEANHGPPLPTATAYSSRWRPVARTR